MTPLDADVRARLGFVLALAGAVGVPVLVAALTALPEGSRKAVFVLGLAAVGGVSLWGGLLAGSVMTGATAHRLRAVVGAFLGLILGVSAAVFLLWTLVSLIV